MKRRQFITILGGAAVGWPVAANAQQAAKVPRIGWLINRAASLNHPLEELPYAPGPLEESFLQGLRDLGYVEGRNVVIERRNAEGKIERLPALAAELVPIKVDVILTGNTPPALALKQATKTIPIVFTGAADPVGSGLVTSLARPGGNVTGFSTFAPELVSKRLQLLTGRAGAQSGRCPLAARRRQRTYGTGPAEGSRRRGPGAGGATSIR